MSYLMLFLSKRMQGIAKSQSMQKALTGLQILMQTSEGERAKTSETSAIRPKLEPWGYLICTVLPVLLPHWSRSMLLATTGLRWTKTLISFLHAQTSLGELLVHFTTNTERAYPLLSLLFL